MPPLTRRALASERDHCLRVGDIGAAGAESSDFARAAAALERNDVVVGERAAFLEVGGDFRGFVLDLVVQGSDRELADAALLFRRQPIGNPFFERSVWFIGLAQIGEDAAEANFFEIRLGSGLRNFIAQLRMQQRERDKADFGLLAGVAAGRRGSGGGGFAFARVSRANRDGVADRPGPRASLRSTSSPTPNKPSVFRTIILN